MASQKIGSGLGRTLVISAFAVVIAVVIVALGAKDWKNRIEKNTVTLADLQAAGVQTETDLSKVSAKIDKLQGKVSAFATAQTEKTGGEKPSTVASSQRLDIFTLAGKVGVQSATTQKTESKRFDIFTFAESLK